MGTDYRPLQPLQFSALFDGALAPFGVGERVCDNPNQSCRCLTDGYNYLWVERGKDGSVEGFTRRGLNFPTNILQAIEETFDVEVVSEHDPRYWGPGWNALEKRMATAYENRWYEQIMHYIRGEGHNLSPGSVRMITAGIAKTLIDEDPTFAHPENQDRLMKAIRSVYRRDHPVNLSEVIDIDADELYLIYEAATGSQGV